MQNQPRYADYLAKFKLLRSQFEKEVKQSKKEFYWNKFKNCIRDSRQTYKLLNDISGKNIKSNKIPPLKSCLEMKEKPTDADIANKFNTFFTTVGTMLKNEVPNADIQVVVNNPFSIFLYQVSPAEIEKIINSFDNKYSAGDDYVSNIIVKTSSAVVAPYLAFIINLSFLKGVFPNELCKAKVFPLHKEGSKTDENNYRPISLLIVWSKVYERAMYNRVYSYFENFSLLFSKQFGFRNKHSTIDALANLTEKMRLATLSDSIYSFFLDLKKAFDTIDHDILIYKLECYGIRSNCLNWFVSYLRNRMQRVEVNGVSSAWNTVDCGVPQGSILGPLLFIIYMNDLPLTCKSAEIILFADDTNLTAIGCTVENVQSDLECLNKWLIANKLVINISKTVQMTVKSSASNCSFNLNALDITVKPVCKYLGIYIDCKLSFVSHVDFVKMRLGKQCGIISKLRHYVPRYQLLEYYRSNVVPILQYGILVYGCCSFSVLNPIFILQKKILKFIYFRKRQDHCENIFEKNKLLTVFEYHVYELLKFVLKSVNQLHSENFLNEMFTFQKSEKLTRRSSAKLLLEPLCKRKIERFSIRYRACKLYNKLNSLGLLPVDIENSSFMEISRYYHNFQTYLIQNIELVKYIYEL